MNFISLCSGIEAASVAFGPLGWKAIAFSEIEGFPSAVLAHHYPTVRNYGDMSLFRDWPDELFADADAIVGGPPCQSFSMAGARRGLNDARGNLTLIYVDLLNHADAIRSKYGKPPVVALYENVPGILSDKTNAFGCLVAGLAGEDVPAVPPGKRWTDAGCVFGPERAVAWRLFDAQFFALAQRRRRVFVVASARPGFDPAAVLFEWDSVRRDTAPSRDAGQNAAGSRTASAGRRGGVSEPERGQLIPDISQCITTGTGQRYDPETETILPGTAHTLRGEGFDASEDGTGRGTPLVPVATAIRTANTSANGHGISPELAHTLDRAQGQCVAFDTTQITSAANRSNPKHGDPCHPLAAGAHAPAIAFDSRQDPVSSEEVFGALGCASPQAQAVAFQSSQSGLRVGDTHATLDANNGPRRHNGVLSDMKVRRLTPEECEALQGFPRGYTRIPGWSGWRAMDATETPEQCAAEGMEVRQNKRTGKWRVKDVDGPRYRALGNSWPVPVVTWIGRRMARHMGPRDA